MLVEHFTGSLANMLMSSMYEVQLELHLRVLGVPYIRNELNTLNDKDSIVPIPCPRA